MLSDTEQYIIVFEELVNYEQSEIPHSAVNANTIYISIS